MMFTKTLLTALVTSAAREIDTSSSITECTSVFQKKTFGDDRANRVTEIAEKAVDEETTHQKVPVSSAIEIQSLQANSRTRTSVDSNADEMANVDLDVENYVLCAITDEIGIPAATGDSLPQNVSLASSDSTDRQDLEGATDDDKAAAAVKDVTDWLRAEGAVVSTALVGSMIDHGGFRVRGVKVTSDLHGGVVLFKVPKKLWMHVDNFPDLKKLDLSSCTTKAIDETKLTLAVALETHKGDKSFWWPYLRSLPSWDDYDSYHPMMADDHTMTDFGELNMMQRIKHFQGDLENIWSCIKVQPAAATLSRRDVVLANMQITARSYNAHGSGALVPLSDLLNTAEEARLNVKYTLPNTAEDDSFTMKSKRDVKREDELLDSYCYTCSNYKYVEWWGVFIEHAAVQSPAPEHACSSALKDVAHKTLKGWTPQDGVRAPQCKASIFGEKQGALRCNLARLAWESCKGHWSKID